MNAVNRYRLALMAGLLLIAGCADFQAPTASNPGEAALRKDQARATTDATVYVVHGINGLDLGASEALPVDVSVNGACALQNFTFRQITGPLTLPAGSYDIRVYPANASYPCYGDAVISASGVQINAGANLSIVAHLNSSGAPTASVFVNDVSRELGRARVIARHTANYGAVDVLVDGARAFQNVTNGQQGVADVRPGRHTIAITPTGDYTRVFEADLVLRPFTVYVAYAVGTPTNGTFEVLLQTISIDRSGRY